MTIEIAYYETRWLLVVIQGKSESSLNVLSLVDKTIKKELNLILGIILSELQRKSHK